MGQCYEAIVRRRLLSRLFSRAARFLWCNPLVWARSILETASRYAAVAFSSSLPAMSFSIFLIDERMAERWLMLWIRRLLCCLARFLAWGEFAKGVPQFIGSVKGRGNILNFAPNVNPEETLLRVLDHFTPKCRSN